MANYQKVGKNSDKIQRTVQISETSLLKKKVQEWGRKREQPEAGEHRDQCG